MRVSLIEAFLRDPAQGYLVYCFSGDEVAAVAFLSCAFPVKTTSPLQLWILVMLLC